MRKEKTNKLKQRKNKSENSQFNIEVKKGKEILKHRKDDSENEREKLY